MPIDALNVLCAQLTRDLFATAKFLLLAPVVLCILLYSLQLVVYGVTFYRVMLCTVQTMLLQVTERCFLFMTYCSLGAAYGRKWWSHH